MGFPASVSPLLWIAGVVFLLLSFGEESLQTSILLSSIAIASLCWAGCLTFIAARGPGNWFLDLGVWILAYGGISFGLATLTAWTVPETLSSVVELPSILVASQMMGFAFATFAFGYLIGAGGPGKSIVSRVRALTEGADNREWRRSSALFVYCLGALSLVLGAMSSGSFGYLGDTRITSVGDVSWYTQPLAIIAALRGFAIMSLWMDEFSSSRRRVTPTVAALTFVDLLVGVVSGTKEAPLVTILAVLFAFVYVRKRLPILALGTVAAGFTLVLSPLIAAMRISVRGREVMELDRAVAQSVAMIPDAGGFVGQGVGEALARLRLIDNLAIIIQKTPEDIPFQPMWGLVSSAFTGIIPRAIWPTKPIRMDGLEFYQQYYGGTAYSSSALTLPGSLYMYGGVVVLLAGMLAFGLLVRIIDDGSNAGDSRAGALLFFGLFPMLIKMEASASTFLASLPLDLCGWLIALILLSTRIEGGRSSTNQSGAQLGQASRTT